MIDLNKEKIPTLECVKDNYPITKEMVETMKQNMIQSFPFENSFQA